jgi:predicted DNA-binding protein (MmcQ/YjbR family)
MADAVLARLRALTRGLAGTREVASWGHPNFRTEARIYCAYHPTRAGEPCIWIRLDPLAAELLRGDPRTLPTSHGTAQGWIGARASGRIAWGFVGELLRDAHAAAAPQKGNKTWRSGRSSATRLASRPQRTRTRP